MNKLLSSLQNNKSFQKALYVCQCVFLFLYTFSLPAFSGRVKFNLLSYVFMGLLGLTVLLYYLLYSKFVFKKHLLVIPAFAIWAFVGTAIYSHDFRSWFGLILLALSFIVFYYSFLSLNNIRLVVKIVVFALFLFGIYFVLHYRADIVHFKELIKGKSRIGEYFDNVNRICTYLIIGFTLSIYLVFNFKKKVELLYLFPTLLVSFIGLLTGSKIFIFCVTLALIVIIIIRFINKKILLILFLLIAIGLFFLIINLPAFSFLNERITVMFRYLFGTSADTDGSTGTRLVWQKMALILGCKNLLTGYGDNGFAIYSQVGTYSHANYSEIVCNFGIVGFCLFYGTILYLGFAGDDKKYPYLGINVVFTLVFVAESFMTVFYYNKSTYLIFALMFYILDYTEKKKEQPVIDANLEKKQRICLCIDQVDCGGAERVIVTLANEFYKFGYEVSFIETTSIASIPYYEINEGIHHVQLLKEKEKKVNIVAKTLLLRRVFKNIHPDVVISFKYQANILCHFSLLNLPIKHIVSERNNPYKYSIGTISKILRKPVFKSADGCVFQTDDARKFYFKNEDDSSVIIPNPVFLATKPLVGNHKRTKTIISVGRLEPQKNTKLLIDAFSEISHELPNFTLKLYGSGSLETELKEYAKTLPCKNNILFMGNSSTWQEDNKDSSLFVLASNYEGMSNSLMEALALGIPCISTDCPIGGSRSLIKDGENGYLIQVGDKEELVEKMFRVLTDSAISEKFSENNKDLIEKYSSSAIAKRWLEFINKLGAKE